MNDKIEGLITIVRNYLQDAFTAEAPAEIAPPVEVAEPVVEAPAEVAPIVEETVEAPVELPQEVVEASTDAGWPPPEPTV